jgi:CubicO group peptidase (beta-lactamase class C family)
VAPKRVWYFSKQKSEVHPLAIQLKSGRQIEIDGEGNLLETRPDDPISDGLEAMAFSGVVLLKKDEAWSAAKGYADRANERPISLSARFGIASGCKIFTAVAVCQLAEEGMLALDSRLSELLPEHFPDFPVTIHQLLTHTSGIPDYFDEEAEDGFEAVWAEHPMYLMQSPADFVPLFRDKPMMFNPGERFHYNNAGFIALGLVVEKITGRPFDEVVGEKIFARAGMAGSGYFRLDQLPAETAHGYIEEGDTWRTNQYAIPVKGGPDGGAFVTATDMAAFWERLMDGTLLSEGMLKTLLHAHASGEHNDYGYGVWIRRGSEGPSKYFVTGYDPGVSFQSGYYPDSGATLSVLSNKSKGAFEAMKLIEEGMEL